MKGLDTMTKRILLSSPSLNGLEHLIKHYRSMGYTEASRLSQRGNDCFVMMSKEYGDDNA